MTIRHMRDLRDALVATGTAPVEAWLCALVVQVPGLTLTRTLRLCDDARGADSDGERVRAAAEALWRARRDERVACAPDGPGAGDYQ